MANFSPTAPPITPVCTRSAPTITMSPLIREGVPGQVLTYTTSVKNNDSAGCGVSRFEVAITGCPLKFTCKPTHPEKQEISLEPNSTGTVVAYLTPATDVSDGYYVFYVTAYHPSAGLIYAKTTPGTHIVKRQAPTSTPPVDGTTTGTLSSSVTTASSVQTFTITITGKDTDGVRGLWLYRANLGTWSYYGCNNQKECTNKWTIAETLPGKYAYYGYVTGNDSSGLSQSPVKTSPSEIYVNVVLGRISMNGSQQEINNLSSMIASLKDIIDNLLESFKR